MCSNDPRLLLKHLNTYKGYTPMIKGKKIFLRAVEKRDLPLLLDWINDPDISRMVEGWSFPLSIEHQERWFESALKDERNKRFIVESYEDGVIGLTGLWEIDWHNRHALTALKLGASNIRGKGYGTDAILTLMAYAFTNVNLNRLWGEIIDFNTASYRVYVQKCGWRVEGVFRQHLYREGKYHDQLRVAILRDEFLSLPEATDYIPAQMQNNELPLIAVSQSDIPQEVLQWIGKGD